MTQRDVEQRVEAARRFNRFHTRKIGVLYEGAYQRPFSLTEVRVLYELAHRDAPTATALGRDLGLDAGYRSRIVRGFERRGLVLKPRYATGGRQSHTSLTALRRATRAVLDRGAGRRAGGLGVPRRTLEDRCPATPAAGGAEGAWLGPRDPPRERVRALRAPDGLPQDHALDPERAARGATPVRGSGVPRRAQGAQPQLRQGSRLGDLGAGPVTSSRR